MAINSYQREMYRSSLEHAERRNHKYLYKIGDRYVYPEDIANGAKSVYAQGQANEIARRKERAESTAAGNQKLKTNLTDKEKLKKAGKIAFSLTAIGRQANADSIIQKRIKKRIQKESDEPVKKEKDNGELVKSASDGESFTARMVKKAANKASDMNKEGQANEINRRKERAESIAAGNEKMAKKIKKKKKKIMDVAKHSDSLYHRYLSHTLGQRRAHHKYLYIDENGRYVYPEDVVGKAKNKLSEAGSKVSSGIKKEKAKLRSIDRGSGYVGTNNKINDLPGSVYSNKKDDAKIRRDYANRKQEEYRKWERHEYFDKTDPKRQEEETKTAKQIAVSSDAKARQAENRLAIANKDAENYQKANKVERMAAKAYGRYEGKKIAKEVENNNKKPHEVNVRKKKSPNKISEAYNNAKKGFRDFGNSAKASYEAGKKAGAEVAEAEKRKKKKKPTVKGSKKVTTWDNVKIKKW